MAAVTKNQQCDKMQLRKRFEEVNQQNTSTTAIVKNTTKRKKQDKSKALIDQEISENKLEQTISNMAESEKRFSTRFEKGTNGIIIVADEKQDLSEIERNCYAAVFTYIYDKFKFLKAEPLSYAVELLLNKRNRSVTLELFQVYFLWLSCHNPASGVPLSNKEYYWLKFNGLLEELGA